MKFLLVTLLFVLSFLIYKVSSGVFHGIRIPDEVKEKLVSSLDPVVDVKQGTLQGKAELSRNGRVFLSFKGIPFGKSKIRFGNSEPADAWKGVRNAKEFGPKCSQVNIMTHIYEGQEDCLTLNVFVPKSETKAQETLPVMVYFFGGAFVMGETNIYQAHYFMDEDVILVSLNYRLGAFGFLNAGIKNASGNQGLKDLVLGLRWIQENIAVFGGDPSRVTIFGESAGGAAVAHLVASPMAKGLFSAAIAQSGVATIGWAFWPDPDYDEPKKLAQAVDCPTSNREYMIECLRKIKPDVLARATDFKDPVWFERQATPVFAPSIETYRDSENDTNNIFLSENIETMLDNGNFNRVPFMLGFTSHEGLSLHAAPILINPNNTKKMNEQWGRVAPQAFFYWSIARDPCVVSSKLRNAYFKDEPVGLETADALTNLYTHIGFQYPARKVGLKHAKFAPVYFYNFTREVKVSFVDLFGFYAHTNPSSKPPVHADDMQFLFSGLRLWPKISKDSSDYEFSTNLVKLWASFAQTHKPAHIWGSQVKQPIDPVDPKADRHNWIKIDNELRIEPETDDFIKNMKVLDEICEHDFDLCSSLHMK